MIMRDFTCETIVIGGDFNCLQDVTIDKKGGRTQTHENSQRSIYRIMPQFGTPLKISSTASVPPCQTKFEKSQMKVEAKYYNDFLR